MRKMRAGGKYPVCYFIGGAARSGKTTLAQRLQQHDTFVGFSEDALLHLMKDKRCCSDPDQRVADFLAYLSRPRFLDKGRGTVTAPADKFSQQEIGVLCSYAKNIESENISDLLVQAFAELAAEKRADAFFFSDIHLEFHGQYFLSSFPAAQLVVVVRDPRSIIAASLYWKTYPSRVRWARREFLYRLVLWCLSCQVAENLDKKFSGRVHLDFLRSDLSHVADRLRAKMVQVISPNEEWFFDFNGQSGLNLNPHGEFEKLLSDSEIFWIDQLCQPWREAGFFRVSQPERRGHRLVTRCFHRIIKWAAHDPVRGHRILRIFMFPLLSSRKAMSDWFGRVKKSK